MPYPALLSVLTSIHSQTYKYRRIRDEVPTSEARQKGVLQYSPLLDLAYPFDLVQDVPLEEFHLLKEGITKKVLADIFQSKSRHSASILEKFNRDYMKMRVFSQMSRRSRSLLHFSEFKGTSQIINRRVRVTVLMPWALAGSEMGQLLFSALPMLFKFTMAREEHELWYNQLQFYR